MFLTSKIYSIIYVFYILFGFEIVLLEKLTVYYWFCCCCHYLNSVCFSMAVFFCLVRLSVATPAMVIFLSCYSVWKTFYDLHAKIFGFEPKWNRETERKPIWKSIAQLKWFLKICFVCFRLFREWQWFFDCVFSCNRFSLFLFFRFDF